MKKLVFGIIAVFFLQVGFVAYNAIESYVDEASNANSVGDPLAGDTGTSVRPDAEALVLNNIDEATETTTNNKRTVIGVRHDGRPNIHLSAGKKAVKGPTKTDMFRQPQIASVRKPSEVQFNKEYVSTISASRPLLSEFEDDPKELAEKRSFVDKALPILKKPYGWLKSLASKIN